MGPCSYLRDTAQIEAGGRGIVREVLDEANASAQSRGVVPTGFTTRGPKRVPRIDYEHIFVLDDTAELLGEYVLNDECPLEFSDLRRSIPINGLRHLATFYQGDYAFTPFRVEPLWFVLLTRGVPRIDERGHLGTLLAAARVHIPSALDPALGKREAELREKEGLLERRESELAKRELRATLLDAEIQRASAKLQEQEGELRSREARLNTLRDYALEMQRSFIEPKTERSGESRKRGTGPEPL
jgi:hypothetical protein